MRERYCKVCEGWHQLDAWPHNCLPEAPRRSQTVQAPLLILDTMTPVQSQLDGKIYDSKAALRATYKAAGVVEVGNDSSILAPKPKEKVKPDRRKIKAAVNKAFSRAGLGA